MTETSTAKGNANAKGTKTNINIAIEIGKSIIGHKGTLQTYVLSLFLHASFADFGSFSEGGTIRSVIATDRRDRDYYYSSRSGKYDEWDRDRYRDRDRQNQRSRKRRLPGP